MTKPTMALDCDGILADFVSSALALVKGLTGRQHDPNGVKTWAVFDCIHEEGVRDAVFDVMKAKGGCLAIPVYESAQEGVRRLSAYVDIVCVTSPFHGSPTWAHEREVWLEKHFGITHVIHARKKERVHADFFADDRPDCVDDWLGYWVDSKRDTLVEGICWKTPRMAEGPKHHAARVAGSWDELIAIVAEGIERRTKLEGINRREK